MNENTVCETADTMLVNMNEKARVIPAAIRRKVNTVIQGMGSYFPHLPITELFAACEQAGLIPLQEDGCRWSGFFCGAAECGSDKAREQVALLRLARFDEAQGCHVLTNAGLCISWGTLNRANGGRTYECIAYVS